MATKKENVRRLRANRAKRVAAGGPRRKPPTRVVKVASMRKAPRAGGRIKHIAGQLSFSAASHSHKADSLAKMTKVGAISNIVNQYQQILSQESGKQVPYSFAMFDSSQIAATLAQQAAQTRPTRMLLNGLITEYTMTNFGNAPVEVDIYDIATLRDIYTGYTFETGVTTYTPLPYPDAYWRQGINAQGGLANTANSYFSPGSSPTDSQLFKEWFKVTKRTTVLLPIAGSHRHMVSVKSNRIVDSMLSGDPSHLRSLRGVTKWVMVVIKGLPILSDVAEVTPSATTSTCQLGVVAVQRINYQYVTSNAYTTVVAQTLVSPIKTDQYAYNAGSGLKNNIATLL